MIRLSRQHLDIRAGEKMYVLEDRYILPVDVELHEIQPHAHYLAREIEGLARLPDGTSRTLIYIKDWDFNWQNVYRLVEPLSLPKGTELRMRYVYDNSQDNVQNPFQPPRRVVWGQKSTDEMGDLWLQVFTRTGQDRTLLDRDFSPKMIREDLAGFSSMLSAEPGNARLHEAVAFGLIQLGEQAAALDHFRTSVRLDPHSAYSHYNLGTALIALGRPDEAVTSLEEAIRLRPDLASAHNNLAGVLWSQGRREDAVAHYRQVLLIEPHHRFVHKNLAVSLQALGDHEGAVHHYEMATARLPEDPSVRHGWAKALAATGKIPESLGQFRLALSQLPDEPELLQEIGWILAAHPDSRIRAPQEAIRLAEHAADLTARRNPRVLDLLAVAYAATSQFDQAILIARSALSLALAARADTLASGIRSRLEMYETGQPYRLDFSRNSIDLDLR